MISVLRQPKMHAAALAIAALLAAAHIHAQVVVQVVAQSRISSSIQCRVEDGDCLVQGSLEDELGNPLPNQQLKLTLEAPSVRTQNGSLRLKPCDDNESPPDTDQAITSRTNETGKFCIRVQGGLYAPDASLSIVFDGGHGYDPASAAIPLNSAQPVPTLTILQGPSLVALDAEQTTVVVQLSAQDRPTAGLPISLELLEPAFHGSKTQEEVAKAVTDSAGIARFRVVKESMGGPGAAQLRAQFAGSNILRAASATWPIVKTCSVHLQARLDRTSAQVGDSIALEITASCGSISLSEGSAEISMNRKPQVALPIHAGHVNWRLSTFELMPGEHSLSVRYVPASAGYIAQAPQSLALRLTPTSSERRALWLVSGILVFLWFAWRWIGGYARARVAAPAAQKETKPQSLEVEPSTTPEFGWVGAVFDSHTGTPIEGASVTILVPSFEEVRTELSVVTDREGDFRLSHCSLPPQSRLAVSAAGYLRAEWPMPRPGKLMVRIETRRRAIVRTFVHWAEKVLTRSSTAPEPTPAEVRMLAEQRSLSEVGDWAGQVERAAFGPDQVETAGDSVLSPPENVALGNKLPR